MIGGILIMCACVCREKLHEAHSDLQRKREVIDDLEPGADSNSKLKTLKRLVDITAFTRHTLTRADVTPSL